MTTGLMSDIYMFVLAILVGYAGFPGSSRPWPN